MASTAPPSLRRVNQSLPGPGGSGGGGGGSGGGSGGSGRGHPNAPTRGANTVPSLVESLMRESADGVDVSGRLMDLKRAILTDGISADDMGMSSHRIYIWLVLLRTPVLAYDRYAALLKRGASPAYAKINDDTHRTLATDPLFARRVSQNSIARLLNTIAWALEDANRIKREAAAAQQDVSASAPASAAVDVPATPDQPSLQAPDAIDAPSTQAAATGTQTAPEPSPAQIADGMAALELRTAAASGSNLAATTGAGGSATVTAISAPENSTLGTISDPSVPTSSPSAPVSTSTSTAAASTPTPLATAPSNASHPPAAVTAATSAIATTPAALTTQTSAPGSSSPRKATHGSTARPSLGPSVPDHPQAAPNPTSTSNSISATASNLTTAATATPTTSSIPTTTIDTPTSNAPTTNPGLSPNSSPNPSPALPSTYVQGMNVLAAPFLYTARSEPQAHAGLFGLLLREVPSYITPTMSGVHLGLGLVDRLLTLLDPGLAAHFASKGLTASVYAFPAVLTLSACTPPLPEVLVLWDFLLAWGVHLNLLAVVAQLHLLRSKLLKSESPMRELRSLGPLRAKRTIELVVAFVGRVPEPLWREMVAHTGGGKEA